MPTEAKVQPAIAKTRVETASSSLKAYLHAGFVLTGMVNTMLGPLLPVLSTRWGLSDTQAGYLFTAQFTAAVLGVGASSWLVPRRGARFTLVSGLVLMAAGTGALGFSPWRFGILAVFCSGIGLGLAIPTTNVLVAELNPEKRAAALSLINLSWGAGAVGCPVIVALLQRMNQSSLFLYATAASLAVVAGCLLQVSFGNFDERKITEDRAQGSNRAMWHSPFVPILAAVFFLYAGSEAATGGWLASYAHRVISAPGSRWALAPSFFWGMLLAGRGLAPVLLRHVPELKLAQMGMSVGVIGIIALMAANRMWTIAICASLAGFGFSSVFPIAVATLSHRFGSGAARVAGLMFAFSSLGGAVLPLLVGYASSRLGSLRMAWLVPLAGGGAVLLLNILLERLQPEGEGA